MIDELKQSALKALSDTTLHEEIKSIAKKEQQLTLEFLCHLHEVERRLLFAKLGFSSCFDYVCALGFSESQSAQRVQAMRLMFSVKEAKEALEAGEITTTQAATIQRFIKKESKETKRHLTQEKKAALVAECKGKSTRETEILLLSHSANPMLHEPRESQRMLTAERTELRFVTDAETIALLKRARELMGPVSLETIMKTGLELILNKKDLLRKAPKSINPTQAEIENIRTNICDQKPRKAVYDNNQSKISDPKRSFKEFDQEHSHNAVLLGALGSVSEEKVETLVHQYRIKMVALALKSTTFGASQKTTNPRNRYIPASVRQGVWQRSKGQCEWTSPLTGKRCLSRYRLQYDHLMPFAKGGANDETNIRHLCQAHNSLSAVQEFGLKKMTPYLRQSAI